jgi:hypothetical protein
LNLVSANHLTLAQTWALLTLPWDSRKSNAPG